MAAPLFSPGDIIGGRYRIDRLIGRGRRGDVYAAEDEELRAAVALKVLHPGAAEDVVTHRQVRGELERARRVTHRGVCRLYDIGHADVSLAGIRRRITFLTMELLEGETLADRLARSGPLSAEQALPIARQLIAGLHAMHRAGVSHDDLAPRQVRLVPDGDVTRAVITSIGLRTGERSPYRAPEERPGAAADFYALGLVLLAMRTGEQPPPGELDRQAGLEEAWRVAIRACLEPQSEKRRALVRRALGELVGQRSLPEARPRWLAAIAVGLALVGASAFYVHRARPARALVRPRRAVAVLGLDNRSGHSEIAWLSTAITEMLNTELGAGEKLRVVTSSNVARLVAELGAPDGDRPSRAALTRARAELGADYVVGGAFSATADPSSPLHVDLALYATASGETVAAVRDSASTVDLLPLVARLGARLRDELQVGRTSPAQQEAVRASLPADRQAARLYAEALERLRQFDTVGARERLERAVSIDPNHPLAHAALAQAWHELGYDGRAREEAKRASELASGLPRDERLRVEARYRETARQWDQAIEIYRALSTFFPDDLEHGLRLMAVQATAGKNRDAEATLAVLRRMPGEAAADPRIDLAEADLAMRLGDFRRALGAAGRAANRAGSRRLLLATAWRQVGWASRKLGASHRAAEAFEQANLLFVEAGDRSGAARVLSNLATLRTDQGDFETAIRLEEKALAIARELGDRSGLARSLFNAGLAEFRRGHMEKSRRLVEEALPIYREIGDAGRLANALLARAELHAERWEIEPAKRILEEVLASTRGRAQQSLLAAALGNYGLVLHAEGDLVGARKATEEALALAHRAGDGHEEALDDARLARILVDQNQLAAARQRYEAGIALARRQGFPYLALTGRLGLARLDLEQGRLEEATRAARELALELRVQGRQDEEALIDVIIALAALGRGHPAEARAAAERAEALARRSERPAIRQRIAVDLARLRGPVSLGQALRAASQARIPLAELEVRLALAETDSAGSRSTELAAIARVAAARSYGLLEAKAARALAAVTDHQ